MPKSGFLHPKAGGWQILALPLILFILLPILAIFFELSSFDFFASLQQRQALEAIRLSMVTSLTTVAITLIFGTPVAYLLIFQKSRFSHVLDTLIDLPTILPPAVAGIALLIVFGRQGLAGQIFNVFGISIPFTSAAVVMAQTFIAAPLYIKAAAIGFSNIEGELLKSAALDGADSWQMFRYLILPISWTAILSGSIMTWARALGEFGATIIFAGNLPGRTQTMPLAIYIGFEVDMKVALTLSAILILISFLVLVSIKFALRKST